MLETQYERYLVINNREIRHQGHFLAEEFFNMLNRAIQERGYEKREKTSEETVTEDGMTTYVEMRPWKEKSGYVTLMIKLKVNFINFVNDLKEVDGLRKRYQKGEVLVVMDAWYMTEFEARWGQKPYAFFLKGLINKLLYTFPTEAGYRGELMDDVAYFTAKIKRLLKSYDEPNLTFPSEEEVKMSIAKEVEKEKELLKNEHIKEGDQASDNHTF